MRRAAKGLLELVIEIRAKGTTTLGTPLVCRCSRPGESSFGIRPESQWIFATEFLYSALQLSRPVSQSANKEWICHRVLHAYLPSTLQSKPKSDSEEATSIFWSNVERKSLQIAATTDLFFLLCCLLISRGSLVPYSAGTRIHCGQSSGERSGGRSARYFEWWGSGRSIRRVPVDHCTHTNSLTQTEI